MRWHRPQLRQSQAQSDNALASSNRMRMSYPLAVKIALDHGHAAGATVDLAKAAARDAPACLASGDDTEKRKAFGGVKIA
jgi:hypothetical protein